MEDAQKLQLILTFIAATMASITVLMAVWVAVWRTMAGWKIYQRNMKELQDNFPSLLDFQASYFHEGEEWFESLPDSHAFKKGILDLRMKSEDSFKKSSDTWASAYQDHTLILAEYSGVYALAKFHQKVLAPFKRRRRRGYIACMRDKLVFTAELVSIVDQFKREPDKIPEKAKAVWKKAYQELSDAAITEPVTYDSVRIHLRTRDFVMTISHEGFEMTAQEEWDLISIDGVPRMIWPNHQKWPSA